MYIWFLLEPEGSDSEIFMEYKRCLCMVATVICLSLSQRAYCYEIALEDVNSDRAFHEGLAVAGSYGTYGYIDASGRNVIPQQFKEALDFVGGMAVVETETGFGIINRQSYFLLKPIY